MSDQPQADIETLFSDPPPADAGFTQNVMQRIEAHEKSRARLRAMVLGLAFGGGLICLAIALSLSGPLSWSWALSYLPLLTLEATFTLTTSTILALLSGMTLYLLLDRDILP